MHKGLSFRDAAALVGDKNVAFKALDRALGGALLVGTAGASEAALGLFDAKGELVAQATDLGDSIVKSLQGLDRLDRTERIQAANSVLIVVSFFETLELLKDREYFINEEAEPRKHKDWREVSEEVCQVIAGVIKRRVRVAYQEQARLAGDVRPQAVRRAASRKYADELPALPREKVNQILVATSLQPRDSRLATIAGTLLESGLPVPAPHLPFESHLREVASLYSDLALSYAEASLGLDWGTLDAQEQASYKSALATWVSERATRRYRGHFQKLAGLSAEVGYWANAIEHQATRHEVERLRLGLAGLREGLHSDAVGRVGQAARALSVVYKSALKAPIVATNELLSPGMHIPELSNIYINPEFRALRATAETRLELESTWNLSLRRSDIQSFLIGYLSSPASTATPLLLLGQPGSGKSVLTKVLAASLPETEFLPVRVVLREIPADDEVQSQLEASIFSTTGERISWTELIEGADGIVPVLLFDGFDELLQSTGVSQSDYLERIAKFQAREQALGRRCVAVVTSRTAVADRARIPPAGITAVRIEPFSDSQVERWTEVWNRSNSGYFATGKVKPLSPSALLAQKDLASQPLLLLMLALYDANSNALQSFDVGEDRNSLYEKLLDDFARRELEKTHPGLAAQDQSRKVESHIHELSVAALGMFNRSRQWVLVDELDHDMSALGVVSGPAQNEEGFRRSYSVAEALIGKFFFVHEARAIVGAETLGTIEFLHATFGEYLVARAVHRELVHLVQQETFTRSTMRRPAINDNYLVSLLSFAALSSRVTILEFLRGFLADMWESDGEVLRDVLRNFFRSSLRADLHKGFENYRPQDLNRVATAANFSYNILCVLLLEGRQVEISALFDDSIDVNDNWSRHVAFLRSQLAREAWIWFTERLVCLRSGAGSERQTTIELVDVNFGSLPPLHEGATPSDWHHGLQFLNDYQGLSVAEIDDHARVVRSNRLSADADSDLALRCIEPLANEVGGMYTLALIGHQGVHVTGAEALIRLWIASSKRGDNSTLADAYGDCIQLAIVGRGPGSDNFRSLLLRHLAKDLGRLPGPWRERMRSELSNVMLSNSEASNWSGLMIQSLGLRGNSTSASEG